MEFYKSLCTVDEAGGAGVGDCFKDNAQAVKKKYDLLHSRLTSKNRDLCTKQYDNLKSLKKSYDKYTSDLCKTANFRENTAGYVTEQYCILQLSIQAYKNLIEFTSHLEKAWHCEEKN
ncbi:MAG: hypothetical protein HQL78_12570 [Magnetococcales bacterium]|nr:hypothetical protein [Magnetococcales bacterium]